MGSGMDDAKAEGHKAQGRAEEKMNRVGDTVKDKFEEAKEKVGEMADKAKEKFEEMKNR